jgi:hypothetical protein
MLRRLGFDERRAGCESAADDEVAQTVIWVVETAGVNHAYLKVY